MNLPLRPLGLPPREKPTLLRSQRRFFMDSQRRVPKERLDRVLVSQGLASSREVAARTVLAGGVLVNGVMVDKPAKLIPADARIEVEKPIPYVSRSGEKLAAALDAFQIDPQGKVGLDVRRVALPTVCCKKGPAASMRWMWGTGNSTGAFAKTHG